MYELSQQQTFNNIVKPVQLIYDETDFSELLITDGKGFRLVAREYELGSVD